MTDFAASVDRLHKQVRHWEQPRWSAGAGARTKADIVHALVQHLADLAAEAEHHDRRPVPRDHDLILPDQLLVMADDLVAAEPPAPVLASAAAAVDEVRKAI